MERLWSLFVKATPPAGLVRASGVGGILFLAGLSYLMAVRSSHLQLREAAGLIGAYLAAAPMVVGLIWSARRPGTRFGWLLVLLGFSGWLMSFQFSDVPEIVPARELARPLSLGVVIYILLAYPMGRLRSRFEKLLIVASTVGLIAFAGGRILSLPDNPFNMASLSDSSFLGPAMTVEVTLVSAVAATVVSLVLWRFWTASPQRRRGLRFVAPVALMLLAAEILDVILGAFGQPETGLLAALTFPLIGAFILLPLAFLVTLLQAELLAGRALRTFVEELSKRPSLASWRDNVARTLDYESLAAENPELLEAASSATALAVEYGRLEEELRASLGRIAAAGDSERRRIARDLHDCAQQRLVTLRIHLSLASDVLGSPEERAVIEDLGHEVDEALSELRNVTHGFYPVVLGRYGIASALRSASSTAALPIRVEDHGVTRHGDAVEHAVYFCCLEALQNAAKHGGKGVSAAVRLIERADELCFEVDDDGVGFAPDAAGPGAGLINLADRLKAVGGILMVQSSPGRGTRVCGRIPLRDDVPWSLPA